MAKKSIGYNGNTKLKKPGAQVTWTEEMAMEWGRCMNDPVYFTENYIKIVNLNDGLVNFYPYDYQKQIIETIHDERFTIVLTGRQSGKTTSLVASIVHYVVFNEEKTVALLANKGDTAREILNRIQLAYENLPSWMQHGIIEFNKGSMDLENGSRILAGSTSSDSIRGFSINFLYIDECVVGDTIVMVRDDDTGEVKLMKIEELYDEYL